MRPLLIVAMLFLPVTVMAAPYSAPAPGTMLSYGTYEGGDTPFIERTETVLATDDRGFVAQVSRSDGQTYLTRSLFGFTGYHCADGGHQFGPGIETLWPLQAGTSHPDGAFLVIGKDIDAWINQTVYEAWAVREVTEHGSTWVTRVAPRLGVQVDDLVGFVHGPVPAFDRDAVAACLNGG